MEAKSRIKAHSSSNATDVPERTGAEWRRFKEESKSRKRKWKEEKLMQQLQREKEEQNMEKPLNIESRKGRDYTVSIAIPGSILNNAQSPQLEMYLVGQIARAATIFSVDEIIIFDETCTMSSDGLINEKDSRSECCVKMGRILQYLECPQYLRKTFFPHHKHLQLAGIANPLDAPHHMREGDVCEFREGVVIDKPIKSGSGSFVNIGLRQDCQIDVQLKPQSRVTVQLTTANQHTPNNSNSNHARPAGLGKKIRGTAVPPSYPRTQAGLYWGYEVRLAPSLSKVWSESPHSGGYDIIIGTSERGQNIDQFSLKQPFKHMLVVFGGLKGLEYAVEADNELIGSDPSKIFSIYLNTCPGQGSRTIRTEEAILTTMCSLRPIINNAFNL